LINVNHDTIQAVSHCVNLPVPVRFPATGTTKVLLYPRDKYNESDNRNQRHY
jgi:hypothetical protein